ncbi:MAG: MOSC N-terminal beta barrel domain-containing protein [Chloroherpetonaceae bacterium]
MPTLSRITIYPIKSLDGVAVQSACITSGGALAHDREYALFDSEGNVVNAKRTAKIHLLRATFDEDLRGVTLSAQGEKARFELGDSKLEAWVSEFFGFRITVKRNRETGFPDDLNASGPTLVSEATYREVARWFSGISIEELRQRFRANLELSECEPFWEDGLCDEPPRTIPFQIGEVKFEGVNPCSRCVVPTRHPLSAEPTPKFQKHFSEQREATLPMWAVPEAFTHFYKLSINTRIATHQAGKTIHVGDKLQR